MRISLRDDVPLRWPSDSSTNYSAYAPDLPGVVATGDTLEECETEMREAIEFHIEGLRLVPRNVGPASNSFAGAEPSNLTHTEGP